MTVYYRSPRPNLTIEHVGGRALGNCYNATYWKVTSKVRRLSEKQLIALKESGVLGYGQEFIIKSQCDGKEKAAGQDEALPVDCDENGHPTGNTPRDWQNRVVTDSSTHQYYVYECEVRCDSGD